MEQQLSHTFNYVYALIAGGDAVWIITVGHQRFAAQESSISDRSIKRSINWPD